MDIFKQYNTALEALRFMIKKLTFTDRIKGFGVKLTNRQRWCIEKKNNNKLPFPDHIKNGNKQGSKILNTCINTKKLADIPHVNQGLKHSIYKARVCIV